jgi:hypothetical protein
MTGSPSPSAAGNGSPFAEESCEAFAERCGVETHPHAHFVRQEVVKSQEIGNSDLHLDHDLGLLDRDLHDGGRGHRLGDDNGVGVGGASWEATEHRSCHENCEAAAGSN